MSSCREGGNTYVPHAPFNSFLNGGGKIFGSRQQINDFKKYENILNHPYKILGIPTGCQITDVDMDLLKFTSPTRILGSHSLWCR